MDYYEQCAHIENVTGEILQPVGRLASLSCAWEKVLLALGILNVWQPWVVYATALPGLTQHPWTGCLQPCLHTQCTSTPCHIHVPGFDCDEDELSSPGLTLARSVPSCCTYVHVALVVYKYTKTNTHALSLSYTNTFFPAHTSTVLYRTEILLLGTASLGSTSRWRWPTLVSADWWRAMCTTLGKGQSFPSSGPPQKLLRITSSPSNPMSGVCVCGCGVWVWWVWDVSVWVWVWVMEALICNKLFIKSNVWSEYVSAWVCECVGVEGATLEAFVCGKLSLKSKISGECIGGGDQKEDCELARWVWTMCVDSDVSVHVDIGDGWVRCLCVCWWPVQQ